MIGREELINGIRIVILTSFCLFMSVAMHELLGHALVAFLLGIPVYRFVMFLSGPFVTGGAIVAAVEASWRSLLAILAGPTVNAIVAMISAKALPDLDGVSREVAIILCFENALLAMLNLPGPTIKLEMGQTEVVGMNDGALAMYYASQIGSLAMIFVGIAIFLIVAMSGYAVYVLIREAYY